jgi:hypothetical protein
MDLLAAICIALFGVVGVPLIVRCFTSGVRISLSDLLGRK